MWTVGFYQVATQVSSVYGVSLPPEVDSFLQTMAAIVSFGMSFIVDVPLACFGGREYVPRLVFWMVMPFTLTLFAYLFEVVYSRSIKGAILRAAPAACRIFFLCYPSITRVAFEAWPCYDFDINGLWLEADVSMRCSAPGYVSEAHDSAIKLAIVAIALYPGGLIVLYSVLLHCASPAIRKGRPTDLSRALVFLHRDYSPRFCWWETMEMLRRFILVGALQLLPTGSFTQISAAFIFALLYMVIQLQAQPFKGVRNNFLAMIVSLMITSMLFCCLLVRLDLVMRLSMPLDWRKRFSVPTLAITVGFSISVVVVLIFLLGVLTMQAADEQARLRHEEKSARSRRLRYMSDDDEVLVPPVAFDGFHVFLSHVWGTGQGTPGES